MLPGTGVVYIITTALTGSKKNVFAAAFGCTMGIVPHILASVLGLSIIMNMSAQVFSIIKIAGSCYLLYLAVMTWKNAGQIDLENSDQKTKTFGITAIRAVIINLLNPKLTIFFYPFCRNL